MGPEASFQAIVLSGGSNGAGLTPPGGGEPKRTRTRLATSERTRCNPPPRGEPGEQDTPNGQPGVESFVDVTGIVYFVPRGAFKPKDVQRAVERIYSTPGFRPPLRMLWDLRGVDGKDLDGWGYDQMRDVATLAKEQWPTGRGRNAFVVASEVAYGLCRMYEMSVDPGKVPVEHHVFREHAAAVEWLLQDF